MSTPPAQSASTPPTSFNQPSLTAYPVENPPPVGYLSRKALPIKRNDAEPLVREDIQYDLLHEIFSDSHAVFSPQIPGHGPPMTFSDLYVNAIFNSPKCSKVLKEKMIDTPAFSIELAKFSLLTNVGRINTTMAFFHEMKTALRTYHPVPSLQKTDGNVQDAPRIKNCLKAILLPHEQSSPPTTPEDIIAQRTAGHNPPTSIVNLIFVLSNNAASLSSKHFDGSFNFLDLFLPKPYNSRDRARAFLWHLFHYYEPAGAENPFDDAYCKLHPAKAPIIRMLNEADRARENVDPPDELDWGRMMSAERVTFLRKLVTSLENDRRARPTTTKIDEVTGKPNSLSQRRLPRRTQESKDEGPFMYYVPAPPKPLQESPGKERHIPRHNPSLGGHLRPGERRSILQQTWEIMLNSDPLLDSDEEVPDWQLHCDYSRRLKVITRIRGRPPTPEEAVVKEVQKQPPPIKQPRSTFTRSWQELPS